MFQRAQLFIKSEALDECENYVRKIIGRRLGNHLNPKIIWKKLLFLEINMKKIRIQTSSRKLNKLLPRRLSPNNGVRAIQSLTLAKNKIFCRGHSVANSHQNCLSGFQIVITFILQMFSNPTASSKTAKSSQQTAETCQKTFVFYIDIKNGGCIHFISTEHLMYKTKRAGKQNFKQQIEILTQPTLVQKSVLAKVYNNRTKRI